MTWEGLAGKEFSGGTMQKMQQFLKEYRTRKPLVAAVEVAPALPIGAERAVVSARVEAGGPADVRLRYTRHVLPDLVLRDDGAEPDA